MRMVRFLSSFALLLLFVPGLKAGSFSLESLIETQSLFWILLGSFGAGILASLTPCIYPMIPITLGIINAQGSKSMIRNFLLSFSYATGIAAIYATLGYVSATSNLMFGQWLSSPLFVGFLLLFFLYLSGSMFGFYPIYIPKFLTKKQSNNKGGSIISTFIFGLLTGAAASPCLTPALALLLGFAAKQGSPFIGFITLLSFAFGMSLLLIIVGTFSGSINMLPRAGTWMLEIQKIFGFLLLTVCVKFLDPFLPPYGVSLGYAIIILGAALYYLYHGIGGAKCENNQDGACMLGDHKHMKTFPLFFGALLLFIGVTLVYQTIEQKAEWDALIAESYDDDDDDE